MIFFFIEPTHSQNAFQRIDMSNEAVVVGSVSAIPLQKPKEVWSKPAPLSIKIRRESS